MRVGEPGAAGDRRIVLRVAGIAVAAFCDGSFDLGFDGDKGKFQVDERDPDVTLGTFVGRLPEVPAGEKLFEAGTVWQLHRHNDSYLFSFGSLAFGADPYRVAIFDRDFTRGDVYVHPGFFGPGQPVDPLWSPLDELLFGAVLSRGRGAEVHACGLVDPQGLGHLFVGASGAGKTTMARLWQAVPGVTILSDDRIVLRHTDGKVWMHGTPWHGEGGMATAASAPLARISFLRRGTQNALLPVSGAAAATGLFACSFPPLYDRAGVDYTLKFLSEVAQAVPCHELSVVPDERAVAFVVGEVLTPESDCHAALDTSFQLRFHQTTHG